MRGSKNNSSRMLFIATTDRKINHSRIYPLTMIAKAIANSALEILSVKHHKFVACICTSSHELTEADATEYPYIHSQKAKNVNMKAMVCFNA